MGPVVGQSCVGPLGLPMLGGGELEPHLSSRLISEHLLTSVRCLLPFQRGDCQYLAEKGMGKPRESEGKGGGSAEICYGIGVLFLSASGPLNVRLLLADRQFPCITAQLLLVHIST